MPKHIFRVVIVVHEVIAVVQHAPFQVFVAHADARVDDRDGDRLQVAHLAPGSLRLDMRQRPLAVVIRVVGRDAEVDADDKVLLDQRDIAVKGEAHVEAGGGSTTQISSASMRSMMVAPIRCTYSSFSSSGVFGS